ncbi:Holliday junction branch migration protein RuvA [Desertibacillus haloalkaliphilus]|uniref:Holliday junction branch migration protein RuvA n=1 Tax=Desertibacillus haloalkaliphilus TaxID=1328930 RepID=UPI001C27AEE9|nr:Holliday junction branch migration protein RuvA [Desertibacillus haloalkaliphilus]MBU8905492.1 Holliday junction branch migration protein RuvA [Desertibacillus haloalkaliphilus]
MIEFVYGKVDFIDTQYIVLETSNIGYQIYCANPFEYQANQEEMVKVYTYQHVREDILRLYGFKTRQERALFEKLLNVSGIGPKGALAVLATGQPDHVIKAIEEEDEAFLVKFPGVGKKTARQMILDLKGKLDDFAPHLFESRSIDESETLTPKEQLNSGALDEAVEALKALGYVDREINRVLPTLREEDTTTDQYIKMALQLIMNR